MSDSGSSQVERRGRKPRRAATLFIFITIVLDVLALGMVIPVMPQLIRQVGRVNEADLISTVGWFGTVWAIMQLLASPVQGALSDRFGRRPVILASNCGMGFNYLMMAVAPSLGWLWAGRIISGICAGSMRAERVASARVAGSDRRRCRFMGSPLRSSTFEGCGPENRPFRRLWLITAASARGCTGPEKSIGAIAAPPREVFESRVHHASASPVARRS